MPDETITDTQKLSIAQVLTMHLFSVAVYLLAFLSLVVVTHKHPMVVCDTHFQL
jgi:hypothetical protein